MSPIPSAWQHSKPYHVSPSFFFFSLFLWRIWRKARPKSAASTRAHGAASTRLREQQRRRYRVVPDGRLRACLGRAPRGAVAAGRRHALFLARLTSGAEEALRAQVA
eukprot:1732595-Rhodomonas_salina.3